MTDDNQPNAGVGRDISVEVGRFECACGHDVLDPLPLEDYIELTMGSSGFPFTQDTIDCDACGREWALVDGGVHWLSRGGNDE